MAGLIEELKRRNVFKVGVAYVVMAWLLAQGVDVFLENFGAPVWVIKTVLLLLVAGFPLALFFAWAFELTPEGIRKEKDVDRNQSITHETGRKLDYAIIAFLVLALGYFAWDKFAPGGATAPATTVTAEELPDAGKSIAVLPFVNMSEDAGNEYFSDGISEEILNALAKVPELQVAGRTSSFAFKGDNQDLRKIGAALGVHHILEGSVRKAGGKVRITAQLIRVDNGFHLWSQSYDRELTDVFAIQDEIANAILAQLKAHLVGSGMPTVTVARADSQAYELYLLAKQRMYERMQLPLENAAELLDKAIAIDPDYAPAYAQRSIVAHLLAETQYGSLPKTQAMTQSKLFADKALQLDPNLAEGWAALGLYRSDRPGEIEQGIAALEKALELNPGLIDAANWLHNAYNQTTQPAKALKLVQDLNRRDPLYRPGISNLEARWPDIESFAAAFPADSHFGYFPMLEVALAYQRAGNAQRHDEAMKLVRAAHDSLAAQGIDNPDLYANEAKYHALAGDRIRALDFLGRAIDGGLIFSANIGDDLPFFRDFVGEPEYEAIQARMIEHLNRERAALGLEPIST